MIELQGLGVLHAPPWDGDRRKEGVWGGTRRHGKLFFKHPPYGSGPGALGWAEFPEEGALSTDWGWGHSFLTEQVWRWGLHLQQIPGCKSRNHCEKLPWALPAKVHSASPKGLQGEPGPRQPSC